MADLGGTKHTLDILRDEGYTEAMSKLHLKEKLRQTTLQSSDVFPRTPSAMDDTVKRRHSQMTPRRITYHFAQS